MTSIRIGRPPRRQRLVRVLNQGARYLVAYAITGWSCWWIGDVHLLVPGLAIAAMLANPWHPKRPARPVRRATRAACHSLLRLGSRAGQPSSPFPRAT
jgi:hypothetical protein